MAQLLDHIDYLSKEIGARPAGTEEEQQAALYIADQLQREGGFHAEIEEFTSSSNLEGARAIPAVVIVVVVILAMLFHVLTIPALILAAAATAIYALEALDHPIVSKFLARGASQNVVAKYQPGFEGNDSNQGARSRKLVLVAHYDSGKVKPGILNAIESTGLPVGMICIGAMGASVLFLLFRIFLGGDGGIATVILNVLSILALIITAIPILKAVLNRMAPYNEGANNNASGVAAIIEVARRISSDSISEADLAVLADDVVMHGQEAALESGLIPEGVAVFYEQPPKQEQTEEDIFESYSEEERLLAAKAAIAALTGRPVESQVFVEPRRETVSFKDEVPERRETAREQQAAKFDAELSSGAAVQKPFGGNGSQQLPNTAAEPANSFQAVSAMANQAPVAGNAYRGARLSEEPTGVETAGFQNAPSWFVAAQRNAKKTSGEVSQAQKSRYTQAIETAEKQAAERERARREEELARLEAERREREELARAAMIAQQEAAKQQELEAGIVELAAGSAEQVSLVEEPANVLDADGAQPQAEREVQHEPAVVPDQAPQVEEEVNAEIEDQVEVENVSIEQNVEEPSAEQDEVAGEDAGSGQPVEVPAVADPGSTIAYQPIQLEEVQRLVEEDEARELNATRHENSRLAGLPSIESSDSQEQQADAIAEVENPSRSGMFRKLRADIPSLSGALEMPQQGEEEAPARASGARADLRDLAISLPSVEQEPQQPQNAQQPVDDAQQPVDYDMELPPLDDEPVVEDQAPAAEKTRRRGKAKENGERANASSSGKSSGGLLGRFKKRSKEVPQESMEEWLDLEENYDPRTVGSKRDWKSFRDTAPDAQEQNGSSRNWEGGEFSRVHLDHVNTLSADEGEADTSEELIASSEDRLLNEEIGQIMHFRNPLFNTEVWFVAIGSDTELHDGATAFIEEHRGELRGAMVVEVESLGAGKLAVATEEGQFKRTKASSRVKRFLRPATEATGIALDEVKIMGADSITTTLQKAGFQAMHILGIEDGKPALKGSADDVAENIDELILEENVDYLMELLKQN